MDVRERERLDGGRERITVVPETVDDLWHLHNVVEPGDRVAGDTSRRIQREDDQLRDTGGQRESIWVAVAVESVEFHRFANRLRVGGEIVGCSREDQLGHHHTLNVEIHDELSIEKRWKPDQLERLAEAEATGEQPDVAIATVEEAAAFVHTVAQYGTEEYASLTGPTGKGEYARDRSELFADLADALTHLDPDAIILAGPGFTKQDALSYIEEHARDLVDRITVVDTAGVGDRGVHEVLARGALEDVQVETRVAREASLIDELTERIATDEPATYGPEDAAEAVEFGAVETLFVVDAALRQERAGGGDWAVDVDHLIERTEQQGGDVVVFSGEFDPGRQLQSLGGIAALLRYRID